MESILVTGTGLDDNGSRKGKVEGDRNARKLVGDVLKNLALRGVGLAGVGTP